MRTIRTSLPLLAITLLLGPISRCVAADEPGAAQPKSADQPWEKGSVSFGGFLTAFDSTLAFGADNLGVHIDGEELLDLDSKLTVIRGGALYRPGKSRRHQLDVTYAAYHRSGHATIDEEIEVGDVTLPVGADVDTVFNFDIIRGNYSYAVLQDGRMRIALGLGVYAVPLRFSLEAETAGGRVAVEAADTTLPLPSLALRADFLLVNKLYLSAGIDAMYLEVSDFKGSLLDVNIALEYRPWKHVGFGLGYNGFSVDVEGQRDSDYPGVDFVGDVGVHYSGLMLYGKFLF
jgi:hypothetical protein